ncbi:hypothetical protein HanRHA438_Chr13g0587591 [Helianthus annuus]|uniref:Uncharacterized protein n=1 Tax=Helianthus annuus TaxID=4232 RepID=A0A9K3EGE8_HELAN|nr:hypothetical protein HanXRQr2_Chr13g0576821 [Helianthus annuus]KAJ0476051.1 hypothetical protein HanHA300_Chr13g0472711 [Helianthus annuus]KAJ0480110.1 hypothetical protein HanIR_Chr13g0627731 [Helianthus annuus]KAJ0496856.1 hypothetical protein HanHA89_Chr13g0504611 [Helianthus annuus]KAJ0662887.1 hypothetical protein HanLR1_Chr13g0474751 [Helianthus annuus]
MATLNRVFGEQVLVAAGMSDKWPQRSKDVPVLLFDGEGCALSKCLPNFFWSNGREAPRDVEEYWYEQIKLNFMYAPAELFAARPVATEGAHIPNPRPCRAMTPVGKEIVYLSSEEFVASSDHELRSWDDVFAGVLRDLGIDHEEKKIKEGYKEESYCCGRGDEED